MIKSVYEIVLAMISTLLVLGIFIAVLDHVHLDHIDIMEMALPLTPLMGLAALSKTRGGRLRRLSRTPVGVFWN